MADKTEIYPGKFSWFGDLPAVEQERVETSTYPLKNV